MQGQCELQIFDWLEVLWTFVFLAVIRHSSLIGGLF